MRLYIGGTAQGKLSYVLHRESRTAWADGAVCPFEEAFGGLVLNRFHLLLRRLLSEGGDIPAFLERLLAENPQAVIICDEVGSGIVPMEKFEREYREAVGRACCVLAEKAERVERIACGIGLRLK